MDTPTPASQPRRVTYKPARNGFVLEIEHTALGCYWKVRRPEGDQAYSSFNNYAASAAIAERLADQFIVFCEFFAMLCDQEELSN